MQGALTGHTAHRLCAANVMCQQWMEPLFHGDIPHIEHTVKWHLGMLTLLLPLEESDSEPKGFHAVRVISPKQVAGYGTKLIPIFFLVHPKSLYCGSMAQEWGKTPCPYCAHFPQVLQVRSQAMFGLGYRWLRNTVMTSREILGKQMNGSLACLLVREDEWLLLDWYLQKQFQVGLT